jgi:hypothetical protein
MSSNHRLILMLHEQCLTQRNFSRLGIETLIRRGFRVAYWDISPLIGRREPLEPVEAFSKLGGFRCQRFETKNDFLKELAATEDDTLVINFVGLTMQSWWIHRNLSRCNFRTGILSTAAPVIFAPWYRRFWNGIKSPAKFLYQFLNRVPLKWIGVREPDFAIATSNAAWRSVRGQGIAAENIICAHVFDYDTELNRTVSNADIGPLPNRFAVFIDQMLPFHPDTISAKYPTVRPAQYFKELDLAFATIERDLGIPVVIASHPRASAEHNAWFGKRLLITRNTNELVRRSAMVITHFSTAINFAVILGKPILFLATTETDHVERFKQFIESAATMLGSSPRHIAARDQVNESLFQYSAAHYAKFLSEFVKIPNSPERGVWEIFADWLKLQKNVERSSIHSVQKNDLQHRVADNV